MELHNRMIPSIKTWFYTDEVFVEDETRYTEISHNDIQLPKIVLALKSKYHIFSYASLFVKWPLKYNLKNFLAVHTQFFLP